MSEIRYAQKPSDLDSVTRIMHTQIIELDDPHDLDQVRRIIYIKAKLRYLVTIEGLVYKWAFDSQAGSTNALAVGVAQIKAIGNMKGTVI